MLNKETEMQESFISSIISAITNTLSNTQAVVVGFITSIIGYFLPVKDIAHLLILFFMLDVLFGYWAAKKLRNERFSVKIIWTHTIPRMLVSVVLILGAYLWDTVYAQEFVSTYKLIGWFISGVLLFSIVQNGYHITKWNMFPMLGKMIKNKIENQTGVEIPEDKRESDG